MDVSLDLHHTMPIHPVGRHRAFVSHAVHHDGTHPPAVLHTGNRDRDCLIIIWYIGYSGVIFRRYMHSGIRPLYIRLPLFYLSHSISREYIGVADGSWRRYPDKRITSAR